MAFSASRYCLISSSSYGSVIVEYSPSHRSLLVTAVQLRQPVEHALRASYHRTETLSPWFRDCPLGELVGPKLLAVRLERFAADLARNPAVPCFVAQPDRHPFVVEKNGRALCRERVCQYV